MAADYYETLGVSRDASADELQQAYRKLARRYHPDVNRDPAAEERFKDINEAYQVLRDPAQRQRYDRSDRRPAPESFGYDFDFGDSGIDFDGLFGDFFGARGAPGPIRGADQEAEIEVGLEEAYRGGRRRLNFDGREIQVNVPKGVTAGQRIRLSGQGGRGSGAAPPGDLYLVVRLAPHPGYRVRDRDVFVDLPIAPWEAALGATVAVRTPNGEVQLRVPQGSSSGRRLRLRGQGIPRPQGTGGDLYAEIQIRVPRAPNPRERELWEELAKASPFDPRNEGSRQEGRR